MRTGAEPRLNACGPMAISPSPHTAVATTAAQYLYTARQRLAKARDLIEETGYHRRDAELAELERQLATAGR